VLKPAAGEVAEDKAVWWVNIILGHSCGLF
jgi:hypothetical protein